MAQCVIKQLIRLRSMYGSVGCCRKSGHISVEQLGDAEFRQQLKRNCLLRKVDCDIDALARQYERYKACGDGAEKAELERALLAGLRQLPNFTHPNTPLGHEANARVVRQTVHKAHDKTPKSAVDIGAELGMLKVRGLQATAGARSYFFLADLARLERALLTFAIAHARRLGFQLLSVPEVIDCSHIEQCGFPVRGSRSQVYHVDAKYGRLALIGTAEMAIGAFLRNKRLQAGQLPMRIVAKSRCYRAETSERALESGLYRVHQFNKVEMFALTVDDERVSDQMLTSLVDIQQQLVSQLRLPYRLLEMPTEELGLPAHRKFDIEVFMPNKQFFGEVSSASNCTNYQSSRLNIQYEHPDGSMRYVHTLNATACAAPRIIMAILEHYQNNDGSVSIPTALQPYMDWQTKITKPRQPMKQIFLRDMRKSFELYLH